MKQKQLIAENIRNHCKMCGSSEVEFLDVIQDFVFKQCRKCAFVFTPDVTPEYLKDLYAAGYHGPEDGAPKKGWAKDISFLEPALGLLPFKNLNILNFGAGQDLTSDELRKSGHKVTAVDIAPPIRPHPDRLTGDILELNLKAEQFDLVYAFQVFEHLPHPSPILEELLRLLKREGLLLIHTDMETEARLENEFRDWWYVAPPDHCSFFRPQTFEMALRNTGSELIVSEPTFVVIKKQRGSLEGDSTE
jgi:2-polyprenyl-3-methyl-5-hydroxy-6-metoxy-1,4-benzoquinol methylase